MEHHQGRTSYTYTNENNDPLTTVTRIALHDGGKTIETKHSRLAGADKRHVFYRLCDLRFASTVIIVEGEKKAEALANYLKSNELSGTVVTTARGGANGAKRVELAPLIRTNANGQGVKIILWRDADRGGEEWERRLYKRLSSEYARADLVLNIHFVRPPAKFDNGWDCEDALSDPEIDVNKLIDDAINERQWKTLHDLTNEAPEGAIADEIIDRFGNIIRTENGFYRWSRDLVWEATPDGLIQRAVADRLGAGATGRKLTSLMTLIKAKAFEPWPFSDANPNRVFVKNCDLVFTHNPEAGWTYEEREPDPEAYPLSRIGAVSNIELDRNLLGEPSRFLGMLRRCWAGDADVGDKIRLLQQFFGACLLPHTKIPGILICFGKSHSGKSTLIDILEGFLGGPKNVSHVAIDDLGHRFRPEALVGKLANLMRELPKSQLIPDATIKLMADGVVMQVEGKGRNPYDAAITAKHAYATNFPPVFRDTTPAMARRLFVLTFNNVIPEADADSDFARSITADIVEMAKLLRWALDVLVRLLNA